MGEQKKPEEDGIQHEIRMARKFTLADAIGQEGGSTMKGASPVPKLTQVTTQLLQFVDRNISDSPGAMKLILQRVLRANEVVVSQHLDEPLAALREIICSILEKDSVLYEFVRQVDAKWGEIFMERPHFQRPGQEPHPDDEYTHESVRNELGEFMKKVNDAIKDSR